MGLHIAVHGAGDSNQHQCQKLMACVSALTPEHEVTHFRNGDQAKNCDMALFWGHQVDNYAYIEQYQDSGTPYLVLELGFTGDRKDNTTLGWNGLNGGAYRPDTPEGDQAVEYAPWKDPELGNIVIMGQLAGDASLRGANIGAWCEWALHVMEERFPGRKVVFREHPKTHTAPGEKRPNTTQILKSAGLVVTYSSNSGVDAIRAGIATIAYHPGSMAWDVAGQGLDAEVTQPCRHKWAREMHWAEWPVERIGDGVRHNMQVWEEARERARAGIYDRRHP